MVLLAEVVKFWYISLNAPEAWSVTKPLDTRLSMRVFRALSFWVISSLPLTSAEASLSIAS